MLEQRRRHCHPAHRLGRFVDDASWGRARRDGTAGTAPAAEARAVHGVSRSSALLVLPVGAGAHLSWTSRFFIVPIDDGTRGLRGTLPPSPGKASLLLTHSVGGGPAGTVARMDQNGSQVPSFEPEEYARVEQAADLVGKSPQDFVRDAALAAADDPFLRALRKTRDRVPQLAEVFATHDAPWATSATAWPDPAPMGSRDLYDSQQHGHAA